MVAKNNISWEELCPHIKDYKDQKDYNRAYQKYFYYKKRDNLIGYLKAIDHPSIKEKNEEEINALSELDSLNLHTPKIVDPVPPITPCDPPHPVGPCDPLPGINPAYPLPYPSTPDVPNTISTTHTIPSKPIPTHHKEEYSIVLKALETLKAKHLKKIEKIDSAIELIKSLNKD